MLACKVLCLQAHMFTCLCYKVHRRMCACVHASFRAKYVCQCMSGPACLLQHLTVIQIMPVRFCSIIGIATLHDVLYNSSLYLSNRFLPYCFTVLLCVRSSSHRHRSLVHAMQVCFCFLLIFFSFFHLQIVVACFLHGIMLTQIIT
jgi:hypothetical protein